MQDEGAFLLGSGGRAADHFVLALPHFMPLAAGVDWLEGLTGVRAAKGGTHSGLGTHNAVAALGQRTYLELIARDPEQDGAKWMGLEVDRAEPRVVAWAVRPGPPLGEDGGGLAEMVGTARAAGYDACGDVKDFARATTSGDELRWRLSYNHWTSPLPGGGLVPFLIAWGDGAAPPMAVAPGLRLQTLALRHPDPDAVRPMLRALGLDLPVAAAEASDPCIELVLETPKGTVTLR